jgi:hypothetical protein
MGVKLLKVAEEFRPANRACGNAMWVPRAIVCNDLPVSFESLEKLMLP